MQTNDRAGYELINSENLKHFPLSTFFSKFLELIKQKHTHTKQITLLRGG